MMSVPASAASDASSPASSSLRWLSGRSRSKRCGMRFMRPVVGDVTLGVAAGQPAAVQRAPHEHAHAVALARRQQGVLDLAGEDRVRRLLGAERLEAVAVGGPAGLDDQLGGVRRAPGVADLAGAHEVVERADSVSSMAVDGSGRWTW